MTGRLILVGTPIGNLSDMSPRAIENLTECDFIAAEDTRVTLKLLNHFGIKKPMVSYFEHNKFERGEQICQRILDGETCCLVTDAGMPAISDPGEMLVAQCAEKGIEVLCIPGPSAVVTALALSGLPTGRFTFEGFLSVAKKSRFAHLEEVKGEKRTMIFYEAPHKLLSTLEDMYSVWGDRRISLARELTKLHEETVRTTLSEAIARYKEKPPKGEFVLVIEGAAEEAEKEYTIEDAVTIARKYIGKGLSTSESAKKAATDTGIKKAEIYKILVSENE